MISLTEILTPHAIKTPLAATTKEGAIRELLDAIVSDGGVADPAAALQAILEREKTRTTGIGNGLAIPHGKTSAAKSIRMAIGAAPRGIEFASIDGKPVTLVILLLSPADKTEEHIQALAHISRVMSFDQFRNKLAASSNANDLLALIKTQEAQKD